MIMKIHLIILLGFSITRILAQPSTEIWLGDVVRNGNSIRIENATNITAHPGYDNQPSFDPKRPVVYFSSANEDGRTDLKSYNWKTEKTMVITRTSEREYSPTVTPDGKNLSCIIQRDNGAQDLGKYPIRGGQATLLINNLVVGYHAWLNRNSVVVFVLGQPQTLRVVDLSNATETTVASNIGRSLHHIPGTAAISWIDKSDPSQWKIRRLNPDLSLNDIASTLPGREDIAWLPDGSILSSDGSKLLIRNPASGTWESVEGLTLTGITRIAVSPDGKKIAVVAAE